MARGYNTNLEYFLSSENSSKRSLSLFTSTLRLKLLNLPFLLVFDGVILWFLSPTHSLIILFSSLRLSKITLYSQNVGYTISGFFDFFHFF